MTAWLVGRRGHALPPSAISSVATIRQLRETVKSPAHCDGEANVGEYVLLGLH
jgi:hypothetical protein